MPPYANLNTGYKSSAGWMRCHFSEDIPSFGVDGKVECCLTWQPKICWGSGWFQILQLRSKHHMISFLYAAVRLKVWVFSLCCKTETVLQNNWTIHLEVFICDRFLFLVSMQLHATHKHACCIYETFKTMLYRCMGDATHLVSEVLFRSYFFYCLQFGCKKWV